MRLVKELPKLHSIPTGRASSTPRARPTHCLSDIHNFSAFPLRRWCEYFAPSCAPCFLSLCPRLLYPLCLSSCILKVTRSQRHAAELHHPLTGEAWGVSPRTTRNEAVSFGVAYGKEGNNAQEPSRSTSTANRANPVTRKMPNALPTHGCSTPATH